MADRNGDSAAATTKTRVPQPIEAAKLKEEEGKSAEKAPPPPPPQKPEHGDCCGSGCVWCVWDVYYDELDEYNKLYKSGSRCRGGKMRRAELLGGAVIAAVAATLLLFGNAFVVEASASSSAAIVQNAIYSNKLPSSPNPIARIACMPSAYLLNYMSIRLLSILIFDMMELKFRVFF